MSDVEQTLQRIASAADLQALDAVRVEAMGKNGWVTALLKTLGQMSPEERQVRGPEIQGVRGQVADAIAARKTALEADELNRRLATERVDLSLPAPTRSSGSVHPVSQVMDELAEIFADLGFAVAEGPEIETDWYNFTALNFPPGHPARAMHDTFYLEQVDEQGLPYVLRTHTSPVQIRAMEKHGASTLR